MNAEGAWRWTDDLPPGGYLTTTATIVRRSTFGMSCRKTGVTVSSGNAPGAACLETIARTPRVGVAIARPRHCVAGVAISRPAMTCSDGTTLGFRANRTNAYIERTRGGCRARWAAPGAHADGTWPSSSARCAATLRRRAHTTGTVTPRRAR